MEIKQLELKDLIPYANNPRKKQAIDKVASSIKEFGWQQPIVVDEANVIIVGHTRYQAAQKLGLDKAPVQVAKGLTDAQVKAYRILDNRANQDALWDDELLKIEVQDLDKMDIDLALTGFDDKELDKLLYEEKEGLTDEDAVPEEVEPRVKQGELWQMGNHRLLCGDSIQQSNLDVLLQNNKADMVFTDPPYNADYKSRGKDELLRKGIKNDNMSDNEFQQFAEKIFTILRQNIYKGSSLYVCCNWKDSYPRFYFIAEQNNLNVSNCIVWNKQNAGMGWNDYRYQFEFIIYGFEKTKKHNFYGDRKNTDLWSLKRDARQSYSHPTQKPVELIEKAILNSSLQDHKILDLFLGSGSTLIACEKTNRSCYGIELDPKYCDVIIKRWEDYTGQTAQLLERGTDTNSFKEDEQWQDQKNIKSTEKKSLN